MKFDDVDIQLDPVKVFIEQNCIFRQNIKDGVETKILHAKYMEWAHKYEAFDMKIIRFERDMRRLYPGNPKIRIGRLMGRKVIYRGIFLKD